jgi:NhaA family Na+:H+ antiporter
MVGKPIGVLLACSLVLRARLATRPRGISTPHLVVLGVVAGVGFTMALFIAQLAFVDEKLLAAAKLGILAASCGAAVISLALGRLLLSPVAIHGTARTADEQKDRPSCDGVCLVHRVPFCARMMSGPVS